MIFICPSFLQNIVGSMIGSNAIARYLQDLTDMKIAQHSMQNIWAFSVQYIDSRAEANNMIGELI